MRRLRVNRRKRKNVFLGDGEIRTFLFDNGGKIGFPDYLSADQEGEMYGWQLAKADGEGTSKEYIYQGYCSHSVFMTKCHYFRCLSIFLGSP